MPERIGRYRLMFPVAAGGMATVYAARKRGGTFTRPVAIKLMLPHLAADPRFVDMFLDEARVASAISSPYVVRTLDVGEDAGNLYIVMELVLGESLRNLVRMARQRGEEVPLPVRLALVRDLAQGLEAAHTATRADGEPLGIVHRDVSPHNLLVGVDGRGRLSDFGIAHALQRVSHTETGEFKGKAGYLSPEQVRRGRAPLTRRSDLFSMGIVAWELLAGRKPFTAEHPLGVISQILYDDAPSLVEAAPHIPEPLHRVVMALLARDPAERPSSARSWVHAFDDAVEESGLRVASLEEVGALVECVAGERLMQLRSALAREMGDVTGPLRAEERPATQSSSESIPVLDEPGGGGVGKRASLVIAFVTLGAALAWWGPVSGAPTRNTGAREAPADSTRTATPATRQPEETGAPATPGEPPDPPDEPPDPPVAGTAPPEVPMDARPSQTEAPTSTASRPAPGRATRARRPTEPEAPLDAPDAPEPDLPEPPPEERAPPESVVSAPTRRRPPPPARTAPDTPPDMGTTDLLFDEEAFEAQLSGD